MFCWPSLYDSLLDCRANGGYCEASAQWAGEVTVVYVAGTVDKVLRDVDAWG